MFFFLTLTFRISAELIYVKHIHARWPDVNILALTSYSEYTSVRKMIDNGAKGYLLKNALPEEIIEGIVTVAQW